MKAIDEDGVIRIVRDDVQDDPTPARESTLELYPADATRPDGGWISKMQAIQMIDLLHGQLDHQIKDDE